MSPKILLYVPSRNIRCNRDREFMTCTSSVILKHPFYCIRDLQVIIHSTKLRKIKEKINTSKI